MNPIRKILVPTDFSPHAAEAFRVAQNLAKPIGASVVLFHVSRPPAVVSDGDGLHLVTGRAAAKDLWDELRQIQANDPTVRVEHEVILDDRPDAEHVLQILEERGCDLIVMGTHGRTGLLRRLFGSVTEDVVRRAHCPVMVVKARAREAGAPTHPTAAQPAARVKS
jgi:nucleotide-binding universal stress UspA family protein